ncbi:hypothetical protein [Zooshikella sp. RANM57]|uniref:hypothetical protein n=1 Tax=Zooshikella sp. RANM57 TaxID=3425863 RepID=UPI003D6EB6DD
MMKPQELILISDWGEERGQQTLKMIREGYTLEHMYAHQVHLTPDSLSKHVTNESLLILNSFSLLA